MKALKIVEEESARQFLMRQKPKSYRFCTSGQCALSICFTVAAMTEQQAVAKANQFWLEHVATASMEMEGNRDNRAVIHFDESYEFTEQHITAIDGEGVE